MKRIVVPSWVVQTLDFASTVTSVASIIVPEWEDELTTVAAVLWLLSKVVKSADRR